MVGVSVKYIITKDFRRPGQAHYTPHDANPAPGAALLRRLTPAPIALVRVANAVANTGLGVAVHDIVELYAPHHAGLTAYVVAHLDGGPPTPIQCAEFLERLRAELDRGHLVTAIPSIAGAADFAPPDCNGNLKLDGGGVPRYVHFQAFVFAHERQAIALAADREAEVTHFGGSRPHRRNKYLYQGIPGLSSGKRDVPRRWSIYAEMLDPELDVAGHVVIDVGCNAGLILYEASAAGARWGVGWDRPQVADAARRLLASFGVTRATIIGGEITQDTDFASGVPAQHAEAPCIVFHLAVSGHIGFPPTLAELPWTHMVYEGHGDQDIQTAKGQMLVTSVNLTFVTTRNQTLLACR